MGWYFGTACDDGRQVPAPPGGFFCAPCQLHYAALPAAGIRSSVHSGSDDQNGRVAFVSLSMKPLQEFLSEHQEFSRRYFLRLGGAATAALSCWPHAARSEPIAPTLAESIANL